MAEGTPVFAGEPILRVTAPLEEAQLVETALLSTVLFQTSVASKAARVTDAAAGRPVMEFGGRRAHGVDAALLASRAAYLGGCSATSNVEAGYRFGIPVAGTMAHSWVMAHCDELTAFERDVALHGADSVLLIDTYNSVTAAQKIVSAGLRPAAVRIDSGDLARVSVAVRSIFDAGPLSSTRILVSGDLDEHRVAALVASGAPIDGFGVGTALSTSVDAPALGGVYKLVEILREGTVTPVAKRSLGKQTLPGRKQVWRVGESTTAAYDVVGLATEAAMECVMRDGRRTGSAPRLCELRAACTSTRLTIPESVRRLSAPGPYPVTFSAALVELARKNRVEVARSGAPRDIG
jgi:nicotinate phosphoribosyltransferase